MPLSELLKLQKIDLEENVQVEDYVSVDDDLITCEMPTDAQIVSNIVIHARMTKKRTRRLKRRKGKKWLRCNKL